MLNRIVYNIIITHTRNHKMNLWRLHYNLVVQQIRECITTTFDAITFNEFIYNYRRLNFHRFDCNCSYLYNKRGSPIGALPTAYRYSQIITFQTLRWNFTERCILNICFPNVVAAIVAEYCI